MCQTVDRHIGCSHNRASRPALVPVPCGLIPAQKPNCIFCCTQAHNQSRRTITPLVMAQRSTRGNQSSSRSMPSMKHVTPFKLPHAWIVRREAATSARTDNAKEEASRVGPNMPIGALMRDSSRSLKPLSFNRSRRSVCVRLLPNAPM